ncbi:aldo/keto reductase [Pyrobaculum neutrophilum]|uniref:Aldo/keto reductase n=1 Tax=Pyrobaculum neutrophilum (strain DSM 2338 / JCM 9278 / NBRC 100436 / V24Sta) TaxID=444157 RepID=B1YCH0_PYRNV|nr:aldo/keto reductase [Pyrobaculum neutrophilum]ACB39483.1 aldo/keto reductase [Pyrobaculum neutrophilum V24Sta]
MRIGVFEVGRIGVGAWQAGGGSWRVNFAELRRAYEYVLDNGVSFIDTAEIYGWGRSEEFVGELIKGRPHVVVATKVAGFNWGRVVKSAERSRRRLGRIDLLQLHWPPPIYVPVCRAVRELERAAQLGLTAEIGVSNFDAGMMEKAIYCAKRYNLASDQVVYNPLQRAAEALIEMGRRAGFAVIAWSPLAKGAAVKEKVGADGGRRFDPAVRKAATPQGRRVVEAVRGIAARRGASPAAVVLAWHAARGSFPIPGVKTLTQAKEVVEALRLELSEAEVAEIDAASAVFRGGAVWPKALRLIPGPLQRLAFRLVKV